MNEIELFLTELLGSFKKKTLPVNGKYSFVTSYSLPMINFPTIDLVVFSPYVYNDLYGEYYLNSENSVYFFLYDNETDIVIGDIVSIPFEWDWKEELSFHVYTAEERLSNNECPICNFWLIQKSNKYGHNFLGCSGFPECTFSQEIVS